jgi:hypothetical protein
MWFNRGWVLHVNCSVERVIYDVNNSTTSNSVAVAFTLTVIVRVPLPGP